MKILKKYSLLLWLIYLLAGCSSGGSANSINTPTPTGTVTSTLTIAATNLSPDESTNVKALFTSNGEPLAGITVYFSATPGLATFTPLTGMAITNSAGEATIQMRAANNKTGVGQVTVTAAVNGTTVSQVAPFYVDTKSLKLANLTMTSSSITIGGSTVVTVDIRNPDGTLYTAQNVDVYFTSTNGWFLTDNAVGKVRSSGGQASATYYSYGVTSSKFTDTIKVTFGASTLTGYITVNPLSAVNISYVSSLPNKTGLNYNEAISIKFKVVDSEGNISPGKTIDFAIAGTPAGSTLQSTSAITGIDGTATAVLTAGNTNTKLWLTATLRGVGSKAESPVIYVAPAASNITVISPTSAAAMDVNQTMTVSFSVTDITGLIPVPNQAVSFSVLDITGQPTTAAAVQNTSVVTDNNGVATTTLVSLANGTIMVKASISTGRYAQTGIITIKGLVATRIVLTSPTSTSTIGYNEASPEITFKVTDDSGTIVPNVSVYFNLVGIANAPVPNTVATLDSYAVTSDANGIVTAVFQSKTTPSVVYILAGFDDTTYITSSKSITISGGPANTLSLQASSLSIASWTGSTPGVIGSLVVGNPNSSTVTARLTDALGIPMPNGTLVSFSTDGGSFTINSCTTTNGSCSVTWNNTNPIAPLGSATITAISGTLVQTERIIMSSVQPQVSTTCTTATNNIVTPSTINCTVRIADLMGHTMAAGTTAIINASANSGDISTVFMTSPIDYTFPNTNGETGIVLPVIITGDGTEEGSLSVKVLSNGLNSYYSFPIFQTTP